MKTSRTSLRITAFVLIAVPILLVLLRYQTNELASNPWEEVEKHSVEYHFDLHGSGSFQISSFLPGNSTRQRVSIMTTGQEGRSEHLDGDNHRIEWRGEAEGETSLSITLECITEPIRFSIDPEIAFDGSPDLAKGIAPTDLIQHQNAEISTLANSLLYGNDKLLPVLENVYHYVKEIPQKKTSELTSALMTLRNNEASCNGKSRLFVALCRALGIEARMVGGLILENTEKRTSHAWAEVKIAGEWVPFDPYNGHFATLPPHYLKIYSGDHFLIVRKGNQAFDYRYEIKRLETDHFGNYALFNLKAFITQHRIPVELLRALLLLPLGALVVALFKNIIGLKSFGVFLPVLIALAFVETGFIMGLTLFTIMVVLIGLISGPLNRWGIQHTPKVVVMLTAVVFTSLVSMLLLSRFGFGKSDMALFFPIIVLTLTAERFAQKADEEGIQEAAKLYLQTLMITVFCFLIVASQAMLHFISTFPEILLAIAGIALLLGKWIGLRVLEYNRFNFNLPNTPKHAQ